MLTVVLLVWLLAASVEAKTSASSHRIKQNQHRPGGSNNNNANKASKNGVYNEDGDIDIDLMDVDDDEDYDSPAAAAAATADEQNTTRNLTTTLAPASGKSLAEVRRVPDEQRLISRLLRGYDPAARPVYNASTPVVIKFGFSLIQICDMDERNQILTTNVWLEQV